MAIIIQDGGDGLKKVLATAAVSLSFLVRTLICAAIITGLGYFIFIYKAGGLDSDTGAGNAADGSLLTAGGSGTQKNPYLIETPEQLISFRDSVNGGHGYQNTYFRQTADIDLGTYGYWVPIGEFASNNLFWGVYDGGGNAIINLHCDKDHTVNDNVGNVGFFGQLGGTVMNLGIDSGIIDGAFCASITSHGAGAGPMVINCYSYANVTAWGRGGGIADNFSGSIFNAWYGGNISAPEYGAASSYSAKFVYGVYAFTKLTQDNYFNGKLQNSQTVSKDNFDGVKIAELLNQNIEGFAEALGYTPKDFTQWEFRDGRLCFKK